MSKFIMQIDGGSRGNPGPAAFGVVISDKTYSQYLGSKTNNEAEYSALIFALRKVKSLYGKEKAKSMDIEVQSDSELLVRQMNGKYKIKSERVKELFLEAWNLKVEFNNLEIKHIGREANKRADELVNQELDNKARTQKLF